MSSYLLDGSSIRAENKLKFEPKISADELLLLVAEICDELHPGQNLGRAISIDSSLDAELGFDSLSRMELIHRIESNFEVSVSDKAMSLMETPRDLLRELKSRAYNNSHNSHPNNNSYNYNNSNSSAYEPPSVS